MTFDDWWKTYIGDPGRRDLQWNAQAETAALDAWEACATHYLTIMRRALTAQRDECVRICERIEAQQWSAYKGQDGPGPDQGNPHTKGMADGAELCAQAICVLANTVQPPITYAPQRQPSASPQRGQEPAQQSRHGAASA